MKTFHTIVKAQPLDNETPDIFQIDGDIVSGSDTDLRELAVRQINTISRNGNTILQQGGIEIISYRNKFSIEIDTTEKDNLGRSSPILLTGQKTNNNKHLDSYFEQLMVFSSYLERKFAPPTDQIRRGISYGSKPSLMWRIMNLITCAIDTIFNCRPWRHN